MIHMNRYDKMIRHSYIKLQLMMWIRVWRQHELNVVLRSEGIQTGYMLFEVRYLCLFISCVSSLLLYYIRD